MVRRRWCRHHVSCGRSSLHRCADESVETFSPGALVSLFPGVCVWGVVVRFV